MAGDVEVVTVHVWRVPPRHVASALVHVARDRRLVRNIPGVQFAKLLGTSRGFTLRDADPCRWVLVTAWSSALEIRGFEASDLARHWHRRADESWHATLRPLSARGRWSRRVPFGQPSPAAWDGPVAALTRARLAPRRLATFWRAAVPVSAEASRQAGLLVAMGIGEAPVGVQGTFTVWSDEAALREFAYARAAHRDVVARTRAVGWYAEELFARFAVLDGYGTIDGCDPLCSPR